MLSIKHQLEDLFTSVIQQMGVADPRVEVTVPENPVHGDYTTNAAMTLAKALKKPPMEIALSVMEKVKSQKSKVKSEGSGQKIYKKHQTPSDTLAPLDTLSAIDHVEVVSPGFINVFITEASLITQVKRLLKQMETVKTAKDFIGHWILDIGHSRRRRVMVEFAHPNTHKAFHIGHLRNITTGESIVRLLEAQGHTVIRANYQGDVGMHIAKCLYSILHQPHKPNKTHLTHKSLEEKVEFLGKAYAAGAKAFEEDAAAKQEIGEINKKIYAKDPSVYPLYEKTRQWSLEYFEATYKRVGSRFDRYYFESEVYESGKGYVLDGLANGIFEESEGAVIFPGKKFGLHNRVFVTGEGNATYEAKDVGLARLQMDEYRPDRIIHVVGPEQAGYFQVLFKALEQVFPDTKGKEHHLTYGWVKLKHGKMSSRTGNVVLGEWLLDEAKKTIYDILEKNKSNYTKSEQEEIAEKAAVAAVKYAFLKVSTGQEIAFDLTTSVSFDGDSGPYLLYTYARGRSVLRKAGNDVIARSGSDEAISKKKGIASVAAEGSLAMTMNSEERAVVRLLMYFPDTVAEAADAYAPNTLCSYLFSLAGAFNLFYAKHAILGSGLRLAITAAVAHVLRHGLFLLGVETLEKM